MILPIKKIGDPILEKPCKEVDLTQKDKAGRVILDYNLNPRNPHVYFLEHLIRDMIETAKANDGIGLAANQVGESLRIFVFQVPDQTINCQHFEVAINPEIVRFGSRFDSKIEIAEEGCLSVPKIYAMVPRYKSIEMHYFNQNGGREELTTEGLTARVIQHEYMHLLGHCFLESAVKIEYRK